MHNHFQAALDVPPRSRRVAKYVHLIAEGLAKQHSLSALYLEQIGCFSCLHDLGKIGIPGAILLKQRPLTQ